MAELKNLRFSFLVIAFLVCNLIVLPFDFFIQLKIETPFWVFYLLELALVFLMIFFSFARSSISSILKVCVAFLVFISACFLAQGFLPFAPEHKILSFNLSQTLFSTKIVINIIGLLVLNLVSCFLFVSELLRTEQETLTNEAQEHYPATGATLQYQKNLSPEDLQKQEIYEELPDQVELEPQYQETELNEQDYYQEDRELSSEQDYHEEEVIEEEHDEELSSLFDLYSDDYEASQAQAVQEKLGDMETILLNNLKDGVTGAMCVNSQGEELHDEIFNWQGFSKEQLLELFNNNNDLSANLDEGGLCQMIFCDNEHWYLIAKYRGNYLLLQTDEVKPDLLIENSFYLVQAIRNFAEA